MGVRGEGLTPTAPNSFDSIGFRGGTLLIPGALVLLSYELTPREDLTPPLS